jgi:hypothetical protein
MQGSHQLVTAAKRYYFTFRSTQGDIAAAKSSEIPFMGAPSMSQDRNKLERASRRQQCVSYVTASLKLFRNIARLESASLQFNGHDPGGTVFLPDQQVIATLPT